MFLSMDTVRKIEGFQVSSIPNRVGDFCGVYTIPATDENGKGFRKLVGFADKNGRFVWVHKKYRKAL